MHIMCKYEKHKRWHTFNYENDILRHLVKMGKIVGILNLTNGSNSNFFLNWFFRIKVLAFRFGCSQTLNSNCWRTPLSYWKSRKLMIFRPMTQPCSWHTSGKEERMVEVMTLFLFGWWKTKVMETLTLRGVFIGFLIGLKWL